MQRTEAEEDGEDATGRIDSSRSMTGEEEAAADAMAATSVCSLAGFTPSSPSMAADSSSFPSSVSIGSARAASLCGVPAALRWMNAPRSTSDEVDMAAGEPTREVHTEEAPVGECEEGEETMVESSDRKADGRLGDAGVQESASAADEDRGRRTVLEAAVRSCPSPSSLVCDWLFLIDGRRLACRLVLNRLRCRCGLLQDDRFDC